MKTRIVKIGKSQGIRIPKSLIAQIGLSGEVEITVQRNSLVIIPVESPCAGWAEQFDAMARNGDDSLLDPDAVTTSTWDDEDWQW